ncbi:aminotransferase class I/II-fold pyridoxal phosphate-dependent enzyme [Streptomyces sp. CC228A]|uniref:aminotransferase class I/II-fold pyridoxal phosphate-dependent enzyme n=1 Tax=Streptomyces sp. CC228A TaxID=2898186 RepID=UPI001F278D5D|nr:aminotransferase class I/II-fold pyridoxal phosphate-dependent enzyme [Streptomyces sp. CC228A]
MKKSARISHDFSHDFWETTTNAGMFDIVAAGLGEPAPARVGLLTGGEPPLMVFDKNAHFCLNAMKPTVADEAPLTTIRHNDIEALGDLCRKHPLVAYVADGVYSTGGRAPIGEPLRLQEKYGLFLFFDEAHGISTVGERGRGAVLEAMGRINDRTPIITSLNKGFGASGGAVIASGCRLLLLAGAAR